jgi:hypothetical protein
MWAGSDEQARQDHIRVSRKRIWRARSKYARQGFDPLRVIAHCICLITDFRGWPSIEIRIPMEQD